MNAALSNCIAQADVYRVDSLLCELECGITSHFFLFFYNYFYMH